MHTHRISEFFCFREARLIFRGIEKPAENPTEKTKTWLDRLKQSLDFAAAPILPVKPSLAISAAERLAGLEEKTPEQVRREEEKAVQQTVNADTSEPAQPIQDTEAPTADPQNSEDGFLAKNTKRVKEWVNNLPVGKMVFYGLATVGVVGALYYFFNRKEKGAAKNVLYAIPIVGLAYYLWLKVRGVVGVGSEAVKFARDPGKYIY